MLLFLLPLLAAADGGVPDDAAIPVSERACPDVGLTAMLSEALLDQKGVRTLQLKTPETDSSDAMFQVRTFRSALRVAVQLEFSGRTSLSGKVSRASLSGPNQQTLRVVAARQLDPTSEAETARIIVEAEALTLEARGIYTLELQDAEGTRLLVLPGVRFPSI
ncbi:DUF2381 family protein [Corallococcus aberystwythensis]|uniref:DUF2381 family protein n=1 Tax=Corallococcus aberystwythensis TaxID=2316722 RepID=A0A3A8PL80_9BACT|nr:DUF2381 family protein [Corallococcus aberystwythensis]RKH55431.1 DUF2381 family protein [Corallococcus aberystwythensis]